MRLRSTCFCSSLSPCFLFVAGPLTSSFRILNLTGLSYEPFQFFSEWLSFRPICLAFGEGKLGPIFVVFERSLTFSWWNSHAP